MRVGKLVRHLERVQHLGAQAITCAFHTVALLVAEGEACLATVDLRLRAKVSKHLTRLYTFPPDNPVTDCIKHFPNQPQVYPSPLRKTWDHYGDLIAPEIAAPHGNHCTTGLPTVGTEYHARNRRSQQG